MKPTSNFLNSHQISEDHLWTTSDVARFLGCSERQVYNLRKQGLPSVRAGGLIRFVPSAVNAWLSSNDSDLPEDDRARQLADIAEHNDEDASECAEADLERESPSSPA